MACYGCGGSGHEAWQCSNHAAFDSWRGHFSTQPNKYTIKSTTAIHLQLTEPYVPPRSPHNLMQECLYSDPWKVLVCCMCLNCTSGIQARKVLLQLFDKYPTPTAFLEATLEQITEIIKPLGLWKKRPQALTQMTKGFLDSDWTTPSEIFGVGKYANDAYLIFCCGKWKDISPHDHMLNHYIKFINEANGLEYTDNPSVKRKKRGREKVQSKFFTEHSKRSVLRNVSNIPEPLSSPFFKGGEKKQRL